MDQNIVETRALNFSFGKSAGSTLKDVNLNVPVGSVYCFLGPNGAGKTTTLRLILGLLNRAQGSIRIFGKDIRHHRIDILKKTGSLIEQPALYGHLTGAQNLEVYKLTYGCSTSRIEEVLRITNMYDARNKLVKAYSLGMKQRLAIALALLNGPDLLILDEPTNGLDPQGIVDIRDLILKLQRDLGKTILVSSHLLSEAEKIATHFGVLNNGRILFQGSKKDLEKIKAGQSRVEIETDNIAIASAALSQFSPVPIADSIVSLNNASKDQIPEICRLLVAANVNIYSVRTGDQNLEETFFRLIS